MRCTLLVGSQLYVFRMVLRVLSAGSEMGP